MECKVRHRLHSLGVARPEKFLITADFTLESRSEAAIINQCVVAMFGGEVKDYSADYSRLDGTIGLQLAAWAADRGGLRILSRVGRTDSGIIPNEELPTSQRVQDLRDEFWMSSEDLRCVTNINDTGAWFPVDSRGDIDLEELLIVIYSRMTTVALYWGRPID